VFVLATTEPEKVLPTIRSRTQHYEFTLFTLEQIVAELSSILEQESMPADAEALAVIARAAAGSMRDALSLLDQALAHGTGRLDAGPVADLFGRTPFDMRCRILEAMADEDAALVLTTLGELLEAGHDPRRIAEDLLRAARDGFLITAGAGRVPLDMPDDEQKRLGDLGRALGNPTLVRMLETLGQAVVDMRGSDAADPRLVLEIALVRLTRREAGPPLQTVVERIERLERSVAELKEGAAPAPPAPAAPVTGAPPGRTIGAIRREAAAAEPEPEPPPEPEPEGLPSTDEGAGSPGPRQPELRGSGERPDGPGARPEELELDDVIVAWAAILPELPVATRSSVQEAQPLGVEDDVITFGVPPRLFEAAAPRFRREADNIRAALSERLGRRARFNLVAHEGFAGSAPEPPPASAPPESETIDLTTDDEPPVDPDELVDAVPDERPGEPMQMLTNDLGATVVEERPRE
jgi:DNA polymerase-3 subunit gamma/tau